MTDLTHQFDDFFISLPSAVLEAGATGRLLARQRTGRLEGHLTVSGRDQTMQFPQVYEYSSEIKLLQL